MFEYMNFRFENSHQKLSKGQKMNPFLIPLESTQLLFTWLQWKSQPMLTFSARFHFETRKRLFSFRCVDGPVFKRARVDCEGMRRKRGPTFKALFVD